MYSKKIYHYKFEDMSIADKYSVGYGILEHIRDTVSEGVSPVTGRDFPLLERAYAEEYHSGDRVSTLSRSGYMMINFDVLKVEDDYIEIGWNDKDIAGRAEGNDTGRRGNGKPGGVTGPINPRPFVNVTGTDFVDVL